MGTTDVEFLSRLFILFYKQNIIIFKKNLFVLDGSHIFLGSSRMLSLVYYNKSTGKYFLLIPG
jgi:hypothetical protein